MRTPAILACVLVLATARDLRAQCPDGTPPPCRVAPRQLQSAPAANSVAVLYFENLSRDTADAYLADGLTEEVTARLGQVGRLVVTSRTAVRRLRGAGEMSLAELGRALNTGHLVNGSVRRAGSRLRVTVELVRAGTGVQMWSSQYDRSADDLLALQEEIATAVAVAIAGQLQPAERVRLASRPTRNAAAYDLYLRGTRASWEISVEAMQFAIASLEAALELDPGFTAARGRLAYVYGWAANWSMRPGGVSIDSQIARGLAAADRALREDSLASDAWLGRGFLLFFRDPPDYAASVAALQRAVVLDSANATAHHNYAVVLRRLGRYGESRAEYQRALAADPTLSQAAADIGFIALSYRRYEEARRWYDSASVLEPHGWQHRDMKALALQWLGDTAGAREAVDSAVRMSPPAMRHLALANRVIVRAQSADSAGAQADVAPLRNRFSSGTVTVRDGFRVAAALAAVGETDAAIELLMRIRPRGAWLWSYLVFREYDPLRSDPRFQRILEEARPPGAPQLP